MDTINYPKSRNWPDFERLCRMLFSSVYAVQFQPWGSAGQRQNGVDGWAMLANGKAVVLQCKGRSRGFGKPLSIASLNAAVRAIDTFPHPVEEIIVLTTAQDEVNLQIHASILTENRLAAGQSRVTVQGWGTICQLIGRDSSVQQAFFGGWMRVPMRYWMMLMAGVALLLAAAASTIALR
jgi:hypothetical protein